MEDVATEESINLIDEICAENFTEHTPMWDTWDRENTKQEVTGFLSSFSDFSATIEDITAEGDMVGMRVTLRGAHEAEFQEIEPPGRTSRYKIWFTRVENGKIAEPWL